MRSAPPILCTLALAAVLAGTVRAQTPRPPQAITGTILLLENDRILEGAIDRVADQYRIRRGNGELWIPASRAKRLCKDANEAVAVMQSGINVSDPDERLRLARWCQSNGLKDCALREARAALEMRPGHNETRQLVQLLERLTISSSGLGAPPPPAPPPAKAPSPASAQALYDVSQDAFAQFAAKVQPVLINTCVTCHQASKGTALQLYRPSDVGHRIAAQKNLNAVLEFVDFEKTVLSPLLIKSVVPHGGAEQPPLRGRQSPAFQTLHGWVEQTVATNPHLRDIRRAHTGEPPPVFGTTSMSARPAFSEELRGPVPPREKAPIVSRPTVIVPSTPAAPAPRDPFDPAEFNRKK